MVNHDERLEEILADSADSTSRETVTLDFSHNFSNVSLTSPYTISSGITFPNSIYTTSMATPSSSSPWVQSPPMAGPKITLEGPDADIEINGVSLWSTMQEIANRLNIMHVNPELETEWAELRELGEIYNQLEQHILDKQATFDRIKAMPAPNVD